jgi:hypothetical protein
MLDINPIGSYRVGREWHSEFSAFSNLSPYFATVIAPVAELALSFALVSGMSSDGKGIALVRRAGDGIEWSGSSRTCVRESGSPSLAFAATRP